MKLVRDATAIVTGVSILLRRGLLDPSRPDRAVHAVRAMRQYGAFGGLSAHAAVRYGDAPAIADDRGVLSFRQLDGMSNALAHGLKALGLGPGDVMAAMCRNRRDLLLALVAANKIGVRMVLLNTGFAGPQLADVCRREHVKVLVVDSEFGALGDGLTELLVVTTGDGRAAGGPTFVDLISGQPTDTLPPPAAPGGVVMLTSGTTGTPKGAPRDRVNPLQTAQFLDRIPWPRASTYYVAAPVFHGTGLVTCTLGLALGNRMLLTPRFDPLEALEVIAAERVTTLIVVPTMLQRILDLGPETLARFDTSSLRVIFTAGSALSPDLCHRTRRVFGDVLYNLYGSTEVAVAAVATPQELRSAPGTVGRPPVGCTVAVYDAARRKITEPDTVGTLFVSSGLSFAGYTDGGRKEVVDGLMSSGDTGHFDARGLWFVDGRDDDMIVSGGENVYPLEVEHLLVEHPEVLEAAVIGVDDPDFGSRLRAYVVTDADSTLDEEAVRAYVRVRLARFKVPRDVRFVEQLPRNETGKVVKRRLLAL